MSNFEKSFNFLDIANKINLFSTIIIICIGLIGNLLSLIIYSQSKYRLNSSNVFILILSITDSLFLIIHFFEDTINILEQYYYIEINFLNIIDINRESCKIANYLRYVLRSISSFIILAFTIQRYIIVYSPLSSKRFKTKRYAWYTCLITINSSFIMNIWSLFMIDLSNQNKKCDIIDKWINVYYYISICYFTLTKLLPMLIIVILNCLIIHISKKDDLKRDQYRNINMTNIIDTNIRRNAIKTLNQIINKNKTINQTSKMSKTLALASFSFVILNLPYVIMWYLFYFIYIFLIHL